MRGSRRPRWRANWGSPARPCRSASRGWSAKARSKAIRCVFRTRRETRRLRAIVMITADPKQADRVSGELKRIADVRALSAVSGAYDMMAIVEADTTARMDAVLDRIGKATGVARTVSSIILSEKFSR